MTTRMRILETPRRCTAARDNGDGTRTTFVPVVGLGVVGAGGTVMPGETLRDPETPGERAIVARTIALLEGEAP